LKREKPTEALLQQVGLKAAENLEPDSDIHASAEYRKEVGAVMVRRALLAACGGDNSSRQQSNGEIFGGRPGAAASVVSAGTASGAVVLTAPAGSECVQPYLNPTTKAMKRNATSIVATAAAIMARPPVDPQPP